MFSAVSYASTHKAKDNLDHCAAMRAWKPMADWCGANDTLVVSEGWVWESVLRLLDWTNSASWPLLRRVSKSAS
jgi:hypothetical protein